MTTESASQMVVTMQETFAGIRVIKSFARESYQEKEFKRSNQLQFSQMMRMIRSMEIVGPLVEAGSPLKFAPREGPDFFAPYGWQLVETRSLLHTAAKLKRLSFGMRLLSLLPDPAGRKPDKPWGGLCVLENRGPAH